MQAIQDALWTTAIAYSNAYNQELHHRITENCGRFIPLILTTPSSAFFYLHGGQITFVRKTTDPGYWGEAISRSEIWIYRNARFEAKGFVVHEMGHAFENALKHTLGSKLGRENLSIDLLARNYEDEIYGGFAGRFGEWQWSREEGSDHRGEIFADMFVGWVYHQWELGDTPSGWSDKGQERAEFMETNMPDWIYRAINSVRGWAIR